MPNYFVGLECEKSLRNRERIWSTQNLTYLLPIADENFIITGVFRMIYSVMRSPSSGTAVLFLEPVVSRTPAARG